MTGQQKPTDDPRFMAGIDLLRRTGMVSFQIRYSDDEEPIVWMAVGEWRVDWRGRPRPKGGKSHHEAAAALDPLRAILRLCDQMVDGAMCAHCGRPSGVNDDFTAEMPLDELVCWYTFDPELKTFRRSCEGDAS